MYKIARKNGRAMHAPTNTNINKIVVGATIGRPYQILSQYQNNLPILLGFRQYIAIFVDNDLNAHIISDTVGEGLAPPV